MVEALLDGPRRFGELADALPGIAPNILTDRLRRLERSRHRPLDAVPGAPDAAAYELTADGRDLASALRLLADWGARRTGDAEPLRHADVRHALEAAGSARPARPPSTTRPQRTSASSRSLPRSGCTRPRRT